MPNCFSWLRFKGQLSTDAHPGTHTQKSVKFKISFFCRKKVLYVLVDQVQKSHGVSATESFQETGPSGGNTRTFTTFSDDLFLLLKNVIFSLLKI